MANDKLEDLIVRAAEIAKKVPESMQEAAFNRALDALQEQAGEPAVSPRKGKGRKRKKEEPPGEAGPRDNTEHLLQNIDRTKHSDVAGHKRTADRALRVLQIAHDELNIDGLSAAEISEVLTVKFRVATTANAVRVALQRETDTVDIRTRSDGTQVFHLMAPGEEYLRKLKAGTPGNDGVSRKGGTRKRKAPKEPKARRRAKKSGAKTRKKRTAKAAGARPGPKSALSALVESGFFDSPRTISHISPEIRDKTGHTYSLQELSPTLLRLVRDGALTRKRNDAGQYEYSRT